MPATKPIFNSVVSARTRTAEQILRDKELFALYEEHGGLKEDLVAIRETGRRAEALDVAQSGAQAAGGAATAEVWEAFADVQREYTGVMAIVQAVRHDLARGGSPSDLLAAVDRILVNEAEVSLREVEVGLDAEGKALKKRRARRKLTQEATRNEIARDAAALLALKPAHAALAKRKVDTRRLTRLQGDADALAGKLALRATAKGHAKGATATEAEAVREQRRAWSAVYRILAAVGRADTRVAQLLREAAAKRR